jgi:hypothetical protein
MVEVFWEKRILQNVIFEERSHLNAEPAFAEVSTVAKPMVDRTAARGAEDAENHRDGGTA